ncbi:MAG: Rpn family recombination-promoting nuclease/putative transposase [Ruminococcus sp.]|nr:Rpn family recombination-promoting nuclease/putative transposase [Ruminococcus sp.]
MYDGEQAIDSEQLHELDITAISLPFGIDGKSVALQKFRDGLKAVVAMTDGQTAYLILGNENESDINSAMTVRNMLYDAIQYSSQVEEYSKKHKAEHDKPSEDGEFLSGFYKTDRLIPVITLTMYFGADEWDAPKSLYEMFNDYDKRLERFIPNYWINLISPVNIADEDFTKFHTDLSATMKYIKYSKDKNRLNDIVHGDEIYTHLDRRTANMINVVTGSKLDLKTGEESVDMCKAIEDMKKDSRDEGRVEGFLNALASLVKDGILTLADAAARANMSVLEFCEKTGIKG